MPSSGDLDGAALGWEECAGKREDIEPPLAIGEQHRELRARTRRGAASAATVLRPLGQRRRLRWLRVAQREAETRRVHLGGGLVHERRRPEDREAKPLSVRCAPPGTPDRLRDRPERTRRRPVGAPWCPSSSTRPKGGDATISPRRARARRRPADLVGRDVEAEGERARRLHVVDRDVEGRRPACALALPDLPRTRSRSDARRAPRPRTACGLFRARPGATRRSRPRGCARASGRRAGETARA